MEKMNCLIAGLPDSGKSTYLGALWYVTQNASGKIELALRASNENMPENTSLLEGLSRKWHNVEDMDRTSNDAPENISFLMCPMGSEDEISIEVPDFRGESIRQIITENQPSEFDDWCVKADNLLFFISDVKAGIFADDFEDDEEKTDAAEKSTEEDKTDENPPVLELEPKNITPAAQNMLILRYLYENYRFKKIVICLTAWDKVIKDNDGKPKDPKEYLMEQSPALYHFITFHFDHSIANLPGQRDFAVWGNAYQEMKNLVFGGMNEAGVVMVSKDVNGNGLPDDPWYEISGSCDKDSVGKVDYGYEITYTRNPMGDIPWTDNRGNSGTIDRNHYHVQEYYPLWLPDSLKFRGTRLPDNMVDLSKEVDRNWSTWYYVLVGFAYGYADNLPNFTDDADATSFNYEGCGIDISWAVDENRQPVHLDFVDFVRVYTGLNQKCPQPEWWGETSTEFAGAEDIHLEASLDAIRQATGMREEVRWKKKEVTTAYDLQGRKVSSNRRGLYIQNKKKFINQ